MSGNELGTVGLLVVFPVLTAVSGAALTAFRPPGARLTSGVQHFAVGAAILLGVRQLESHGDAAPQPGRGCLGYRSVRASFVVACGWSIG